MNDLNSAHASTEPADAKLSAALIRSRQNLREASNSLRGYDGRDKSLLNIAEDIKETSEVIYDRMKKKSQESIN
jgi:hypothetical protein